MGEPILYHGTVSFIDGRAGSESDKVSWRIGFRIISTHIDAELGGRVFSINGEKIYIEGGNMIASDQFQRHNDDPTRYFDEVKIHKNAGLNTIRLWGANGGHGRSLYDAGDELGVLFVMEFWMSGDNNGRWAGSYDWPIDRALFLEAAADAVRMVRGHPSVLFYSGGNEIYPEGMSPPHEIAINLPNVVRDLDPSGRVYVPSSMSNWIDYDPEWGLCPQDGPYRIQDERLFYQRNAGLLWDVNKTLSVSLKIAFQPEVGRIACPEIESVLRFLSPEAAAEFPQRGALTVNVSKVWSYRRFESFTDINGYDHIYAYGDAANITEFVFRAQLAQFRQFQALFEGFAQHMFEWYQAVILWKSQSPWPSFRGHIYDSYLSTNSVFWAIRSATRSRLNLHIQLNQLTREVSILNRGATKYDGHLNGIVQAFEISTGKLVYELAQTVSEISGQSVYVLPEKIVWPNNVEPVLLWRCKLESSDASISFPWSDYWLNHLSDDLNVTQDFSYLSEIREDTANYAPLEGSSGILHHSLNDGDRITVAVNLSLPSSSKCVAFACRVSLHHFNGAREDEQGDTRVLPVWQTDNYFSVVPGQAISVLIEADAKQVTRGGMVVKIVGWNVHQFVLPLNPNSLGGSNSQSTNNTFHGGR
eukprot:TRINITY_DN8511_c0_g1_i1.p1 TRINITY_DN8511_c0_g1~~TRINITY_DN8511_c0_g1_i1.p1  ORF type:complete len:724 (-),score=141.44 TRINITY_DN8511_c0_g1_i1:1227-3158(-)